MFQFRRFPAYCYFIHSTLTRYCRAGFPHSDICGSRDICSSPQLFAACRVLLRLLMPRHSPCALISLTSSAQSPFGSVSGASLRLPPKTALTPLPLLSNPKLVLDLVRSAVSSNFLRVSLWSHSCSQNYAGFTEVSQNVVLPYLKSSTCCLLRSHATPSVALLAFHLPLFSFQGAVKRVTLAGVQSADRCGICVPSKLNNVSGEGLT